MKRWRITLAGAAAVVALCLVTCSRATSTESVAPDCSCAGAPLVDKTLVAFLSKARAAHHAADLAEENGDTDLAIAALEAVVRGPRPVAPGSPAGGPPNMPEAAEVIADTHARLADLRSELGAFDAALHDVDDGLALAAGPTHFRGHLFEVKGLVLERRARALDAQGEVAGAAVAKAAAVDAFDAAVKIQDQVITEALSNGGR
jgi:hypothetical protein